MTNQAIGHQGVVGGGTAAVAAFGGSCVLMATRGQDYTVVLADNSAVWTRGFGADGVLGYSDLGTSMIQMCIESARFSCARIVSVSAGITVSMAMSAEGILYSWGTGSLSQSTCNQTLLVPTPVAASLLLGSRFRRGGGLPALHTIAFCMGTHLRLSKASALTQQEGDNKGCPYQSFADDMLKHIVEYSSILTGAYVHMSEGLPAGSAHESNLMACALGNAAEESSLQDTGESRIVQV